MRIKNKLFPYPVMNDEKLYTGFKSSEFKFTYDYEMNEDNFIIKNLIVHLNNTNLLNLYEEGKINIVCIVECARSMFRKAYNLTLEPNEIIIPKYDIVGKIEVSAFIYANETITDYYSEDFLDDYEENSMYIEKNCILAIDNGYHQRIDYDFEEDNKKTAIFAFVTNDDEDCRVVKYEYETDIIKILIPKLQHAEYETMKYDEVYTKAFLSMFVVSPLSMIISEFLREGSDVEGLKIQYRWFISVCEAYKKIYGKELEDEEFYTMSNLDIYEICQNLFDCCVLGAIDDLYDFRNNRLGGFEDED